MSQSTYSQPSVTESGSMYLDEAQIIEFAQQFDPQPYHLDKAAGDASIFGGLCASGWQIAALGTRLVGDALAENAVTFIALTRVDSLRWRRPSFVDEALRASVTLEHIEPGSHVPGCDSAHIHVELINAQGDVVAVMQCIAAVETSRQTVIGEPS